MILARGLAVMGVVSFGRHRKRPICVSRGDLIVLLTRLRAVVRIVVRI
jgi:hypothetical protein